LLETPIRFICLLSTATIIYSFFYPGKKDIGLTARFQYFYLPRAATDYELFIPLPLCVEIKPVK
jgi:hypothetical protein